MYNLGIFACLCVFAADVHHRIIDGLSCLSKSDCILWGYASVTYNYDLMLDGRRRANHWTAAKNERLSALACFLLSSRPFIRYFIVRDSAKRTPPKSMS